MRSFEDRLPTKPNRYKMVKENGTSEYVTMERADGATVEGTPLNREAMLATQGFEGLTTVFNDDGSITETNAKGDRLITQFPVNGNIVETLIGADGMTISKTTKFNDDGSISEVMS